MLCSTKIFRVDEIFLEPNIPQLATLTAMQSINSLHQLSLEARISRSEEIIHLAQPHPLLVKLRITVRAAPTEELEDHQQGVRTY